MTRYRTVNIGPAEIPNNQWHLNKSIPLALIVSLLGFFFTQTTTIVWFAAHLDNRVGVLEKAQAITERNSEQLVHVKDQLIAVDNGVADIKYLLTKQSGGERARR